MMFITLRRRTLPGRLLMSPLVFADFYRLQPAALGRIARLRYAARFTWNLVR